MATEDNGAKAGAPAQNPQKTTAPGAPGAPPSTTAPAPAGESEAPKLTPAQLKAKAKAEKAVRRAQAKETKAAVAAASPAPAGSGNQDAKTPKGKGKQDGGGGGGGGGGLQPPNMKSTHTHRPSVSGGRRPSFAVMEKDARSFIPECFSHLPMAKRVQTSHAHKDVHPAVLAAGQQMATFAIKDSISRLEATLLAFKKVTYT